MTTLEAGRCHVRLPRVFPDTVPTSHCAFLTVAYLCSGIARTLMVFSNRQDMRKVGMTLSQIKLAEGLLLLPWLLKIPMGALVDKALQHKRKSRMDLRLMNGMGLALAFCCSLNMAMVATWESTAASEYTLGMLLLQVTLRMVEVLQDTWLVRATKNEPRQSQGRGINAMTSWSAVGMMMGSLISGTVMHVWGSAEVFMLEACLCLLGIAVLQMTSADKAGEQGVKHEHQNSNHGDLDANGAEEHTHGEEQTTEQQGVVAFIRNNPTPFKLLLMNFISMLMPGTGAVSYFFLLDELGYSILWLGVIATTAHAVRIAALVFYDAFLRTRQIRGLFVGLQVVEIFTQFLPAIVSSGLYLGTGIPAFVFVLSGDVMGEVLDAVRMQPMQIIFSKAGHEAILFQVGASITSLALVLHSGLDAVVIDLFHVGFENLYALTRAAVFCTLLECVVPMGFMLCLLPASGSTIQDVVARLIFTIPFAFAVSVIDKLVTFLEWTVIFFRTLIWLAQTGLELLYKAWRTLALFWVVVPRFVVKWTKWAVSKILQTERGKKVSKAFKQKVAMPLKRLLARIMARVPRANKDRLVAFVPQGTGLVSRVLRPSATLAVKSLLIGVRLGLLVLQEVLKMVPIFLGLSILVVLIVIFGWPFMALEQDPRTVTELTALSTDLSVGAYNVAARTWNSYALFMDMLVPPYNVLMSFTYRLVIVIFNNFLENFGLLDDAQEGQTTYLYTPDNSMPGDDDDARVDHREASSRVLLTAVERDVMGLEDPVIQGAFQRRAFTHRRDLGNLGSTTSLEVANGIRDAMAGMAAIVDVVLDFLIIIFDVILQQRALFYIVFRKIYIVFKLILGFPCCTHDPGCCVLELTVDLVVGTVVGLINLVVSFFANLFGAGDVQIFSDEVLDSLKCQSGSFQQSTPCSCSAKQNPVGFFSNLDECVQKRYVCQQKSPGLWVESMSEDKSEAIWNEVASGGTQEMGCPHSRVTLSTSPEEARRAMREAQVPLHVPIQQEGHCSETCLLHNGEGEGSIGWLFRQCGHMGEHGPVYKGPCQMHSQGRRVLMQEGRGLDSGRFVMDYSDLALAEGHTHTLSGIPEHLRKFLSSPLLSQKKRLALVSVETLRLERIKELHNRLWEKKDGVSVLRQQGPGGIRGDRSRGEEEEEEAIEEDNDMLPRTMRDFEEELQVRRRIRDNNPLRASTQMVCPEVDLSDTPSDVQSVLYQTACFHSATLDTFKAGGVNAEPLKKVRSHIWNYHKRMFTPKGGAAGLKDMNRRAAKSAGVSGTYQRSRRGLSQEEEEEIEEEEEEEDVGSYTKVAHKYLLVLWHNGHLMSQEAHQRALDDFHVDLVNFHHQKMRQMGLNTVAGAHKGVTGRVLEAVSSGMESYEKHWELEHQEQQRHRRWLLSEAEKRDYTSTGATGTEGQGLFQDSGQEGLLTLPDGENAICAAPFTYRCPDAVHCTRFDQKSKCPKTQGTSYRSVSHDITLWQESFSLESIARLTSSCWKELMEDPDKDPTSFENLRCYSSLARHIHNEEGGNVRVDPALRNDCKQLVFCFPLIQRFPTLPTTGFTLMGYLQSLCGVDSAGFGQAGINRCFCPMYPQADIDDLRDNQGQWLPGIQVSTRARLSLALKTFQILVVGVHDLVFQTGPTSSVSQGQSSSFSSWWAASWRLVWPTAPDDLVFWFDSQRVLQGASMGQISTCVLMHLYSTLWGVFWAIVVFILFRFSLRILLGTFTIVHEVAAWTIQVVPLRDLQQQKGKEKEQELPKRTTTVFKETRLKAQPGTSSDLLLARAIPQTPRQARAATVAPESPHGLLHSAGGAAGLRETLRRRRHHSHLEEDSLSEDGARGLEPIEEETRGLFQV